MTTENKISLQIAVPVPLRQYFDYLPPDAGEWRHLKPGMRVKIPFQHRELIGIFMGFSTNPSFPFEKLKPIIEVLDSEVLIEDDIMQLCLWAADYYHYPVGEILIHALPVMLRKGKPLKAIKENAVSENISTIGLTLNAAQQTAIAAIHASIHQFQVFLLNGVTGSGKTEVYLQAITLSIQENKQVLVMIPEIGLTPQTIQRFQERFSVPVIALHSGLTEKQRLQAWTQIRLGKQAIVIGTRSAIFSPFKNLGLIIVDEEHDISYKQQDMFRYHARDLAIMRAHFNNIPIVLGSATPALETLHKAEQGKFHYLSLPERAGNAVMPAFEIVDIRNKPLEQGLSQDLLNEIKQHLIAGNQVMLFLNRRGFAPALLCHSCGWMVNCKRCDMRMTYHQHTKRLHCHHCDTQKFTPKRCEACGCSELVPVGMGTERLELALEKYFPDVPIARMDRDNTQRKGSMEALLDGVQSGHYRILVGTQMLAKGHHFPNVTLVGIVDADGGFFSSDFRAIERMGQLLMQVSGRAGRVEKAGKVMIQTHHPDHPLIHQLFKESYEKFAGSLLQERAAASLPPYAYFALFRAEAYNLEHATNFLKQVKDLINPSGKNLQVLGPIPAPMPRRAGRCRAQLLVQAAVRPQLQSYLKHVIPDIEQMSMKHRVRWSLDVDPMEMF
jgi:primosomal protein N' (replication factor Y)